MQLDVKQGVGGVLTVALLVMLVNMIGNRTLNLSSPEETALMAGSDAEVVAESAEIVIRSFRHDGMPKDLWGREGPVLRPCWNQHIKGRRGRTRGYVIVKLSNGPQHHPSQVADAVIVARHLGATLLLPTIKEAPKEPNSDFDKIYDVNNFISSLKDVVRVVGRLPEFAHGVQPVIVKVPHKVNSHYIEEKVQPLFKQHAIIQLSTVFSASKVNNTSDEEEQAIRCLVTYSALRFHFQVQKLGNRIINRLREGGEAFGGRFIAVDLRLDALEQNGCAQLENGKRKKCFNGSDVATFLKNLGFTSETAIYLTQSRWDTRLDLLTEVFPNIHTKEYSMPFNEEKQIVYSGNTQFEKAIDFYICMHSDVFVPAILGLSYTTIAGRRIALGKTQILVPSPAKNDASKLKVAAALSKLVTRRAHNAYTCFCEPLSDANEE